MKAFFLLSANDFSKLCIFLRLIQADDKTVVTTSGYSEEAAHDRYRIFLPMAMDDCVFSSCPHFLSVDCRKSRSSLFSIFRRSISIIFIFVHFLLLIATPPDVVLFSYIKGCFVYCLFLLDLCNFNRPAADYHSRSASRRNGQNG